MIKLSMLILSLSAIGYLWVSSYTIPEVGLTPSALLAGLAGYLAMLRFLTGKKIDPEFWKLLLVSLSLLMWAALVYILSGFGLPRRLMQIALGITVAFSVYTIAASYARIKLLIGAMIVGAVVSSLVGVGQFFIGGPFISLWLVSGGTKGIALQSILGGRIAGLAPNQVALSYQLATLVPLVAALWWGLRGKGGKLIQMGLGGAVGVMALALVLTEVRAAISGAALGSIFAILLVRGRPRHWRRSLIAAVVASAVIYIVVGWFYNPTRFIEMRGVSAKVRLPMQETAITYALHHPFGTGYYMLSAGYLPSGINSRLAKVVLENTTHNQFLNTLVCYGFLGLASLIVFYWILFRDIYVLYRRLGARPELKEIKWLPAGIAGALVGYLINSMFHNAGPFVGDIFNWYVIGLAFASYRALRSANQPGMVTELSPLRNRDG